MDRRYTLLAILLIILAAGLIIIPDRSDKKEMKPEQLLSDIHDEARFISTDAVTERIIGNDPTLQLVDVRTPDEFRRYALPGAVNIPLDSILSQSWEEILQQKGKDKIFYSNGDIAANEAWQLCARNSITRVFVMKGGLNQWYNTIIKGEKPTNTASETDLELYSFRQSARQFFIGGTPPATDQSDLKTGNKNATKVKVIKKPADKSSGGGC